MAKKDKDSKSPLVRRQSEIEDKIGYQLKPEEERQYAKIILRISLARQEREIPRDEFDGQSYEQVYISNRRAGHSYLQPKRNDDEVRIVTGTTEKRIELVQNELLALNLKEEIRTFDMNDNFLRELSNAFTDIVERTEQIEMAADKDIYFYNELLTQPSVFVEELFIEEPATGPKKSLRTRKRCERRMIQGVQIFLGDVNMPDIRFNDQPYLIKYARMGWDEGKRFFRDINPEKWDKYVRPGAYAAGGGSVSNLLYRKGTLQEQEIEIYWYMSYPDDEIQIIINGIPMLEVGSKYTDFYGNLGGYHIVMVSLKPYAWDFAYGKPLTQSAKTLQALDNETIRNLVRKFRQVLEPPMGTPKGRMFSRDIWNPGTMIQGVKAGDFEKLIDHQGVTRSEMAMFDLIEKKVNEFIGSSQQDPLEGKTKVTATEITAAQRQAIKMLGLAVLAAMKLKNRLALLRVRNVLNNYFKPLGKKMDVLTKEVHNVFARFSLNDVNVNGQNGDRIIQLADRSLDDGEKEQLFRKEQELKKQGKNVEFKVINVNKIKNLEMYFYAITISKPKESTDLDKAMVQEKLNQAASITQMTGRRINAQKFIEGFERAWRERDLFEKEAPQSIGGMEQQLQQAQQQGGGPKPSPAGQRLNSLTNQGGIGKIPEPGAVASA